MEVHPNSDDVDCCGNARMQHDGEERPERNTEKHEYQYVDVVEIASPRHSSEPSFKWPVVVKALSHSSTE